jgi:hypothetical protein
VTASAHCRRRDRAIRDRAIRAWPPLHRRPCSRQRAVWAFSSRPGRPEPGARAVVPGSGGAGPGAGDHGGATRPPGTSGWGWSAGTPCVHNPAGGKDQHLPAPLARDGGRPDGSGRAPDRRRISATCQPGASQARSGRRAARALSRRIAGGNAARVEDLNAHRGHPPHPVLPRRRVRLQAKDIRLNGVTCCSCENSGLAQAAQCPRAISVLAP